MPQVLRMTAVVATITTAATVGSKMIRSAVAMDITGKVRAVVAKRAPGAAVGAVAAVLDTGSRRSPGPRGQPVLGLGDRPDLGFGGFFFVSRQCTRLGHPRLLQMEGGGHPAEEASRRVEGRGSYA